MRQDALPGCIIAILLVGLRVRPIFLRRGKFINAMAGLVNEGSLGYLTNVIICANEDIIVAVGSTVSFRY